MKTIVVLGAGLAAAPLIRQIMRTAVLTRKDLRMIVVAPNTHFHWPIAMPRVVVPGQMADEKVMYPLDTIFGQYPADKFEFVLGKASTLDPSGRLITVALNAGGVQSVAYDTLIVATGSSAKDDMPWKTLGTTDKTVETLRRLQKDIRDAKTIVVAGGGLTGAETAGELGFEYAKDGTKEVYFIHNRDLPLSPPVLHSVRKQIKVELEKMKVKVVANTTVTKVTKSSGGDTVLELREADGSTRTLRTQAYVPTTGLTPNTSFAPASMLDDGGFIKQTTHLQAEGYDDIFVIGDAGSLEVSKAYIAEAQMVHLVKALPVYLDGGKMAEYKVNSKEMVGITLGRSRATGQMGKFRVFSFLIWYMKGRFLGTDYAGLYAAGKKTMMTTFEK
ncbi:Pyridine nucleotide-disulfide oxidoreductase, NAD-binding domain protein [Drechmeria coniospora]|uniref:Pyridine nucleotide-disulfide oxidoreductase, NAD-binding domain protein n=1 Tax=Drechmeria coniospora TaxID=98403 RepID=A0A151GIB2_DRECN|nr:Pyridine nucleotide-disulfide oxidoreductase, NAD-binding domain protein [Drechmeria coniospora]KYK56837.1 Pyridine nucleotide-disulfide oxidoreductase, NAD-binding domain protein [Drechmeria coniospora]